MRSTRKKTSKGTIAILVVAIAAVQIAIFFVIRDSGNSQKGPETPGKTVSANRETPKGQTPTPAIDTMEHEKPARELATTSVDAGSPQLAESTAIEPEAVGAADEIANEDETGSTKEVAKANRTASARSARPRGAKSGRGSDTKSASATSEPPPIESAPATGSVSISTSPAGATVALDGVFIGKSPIGSVEMVPGRHSVALSLSGYSPKVVTLRIDAGRDQRMSETLVKVATLPKVDAPSKPAPELVVADRLPRTPRVSSSSEGSASKGQGLLASTCNGCHKKNGVSSVGPRRFTVTQWDRFFSRGSHDRYQRIGGAVSAAQLTHVKTYLKSKAADVARNQGAGIR